MNKITISQKSFRFFLFTLCVSFLFACQNTSFNDTLYPFSLNDEKIASSPIKKVTIAHVNFGAPSKKYLRDEQGKIEATGKRVNKNNIPSREKFIDLSGKHIFPGIVDMRVFGGEPGFEYKENYRSLSEAALAGGVTSAVSYTHLTLPTKRIV